jgi:hypothetical protein
MKVDGEKSERKIMQNKLESDDLCCWVRDYLPCLRRDGNLKWNWLPDVI